MNTKEFLAIYMHMCYNLTVKKPKEDLSYELKSEYIIKLE